MQDTQAPPAGKWRIHIRRVYGSLERGPGSPPTPGTPWREVEGRAADSAAPRPGVGSPLRPESPTPPVLVVTGRQGARGRPHLQATPWRKTGCDGGHGI